MLRHYGTETGVRMARKHVAWYSRGLAGSAEFRAAVNQLSDPAQIRELVRRFYAPLVERAAA
jgi:tRNA-dihydrouridine synthase B